MKDYIQKKLVVSMHLHQVWDGQLSCNVYLIAILCVINSAKTFVFKK